jgi:hypothetical protein
MREIANGMTSALDTLAQLVDRFFDLVYQWRNFTPNLQTRFVDLPVPYRRQDLSQPLDNQERFTKPALSQADQNGRYQEYQRKRKDRVMQQLLPANCEGVIQEKEETLLHLNCLLAHKGNINENIGPVSRERKPACPEQRHSSKAHHSDPWMNVTDQKKTLLYRIIDRHYPEFISYMAEQGKFLPHHVQKEFDEYLRCGRLEHGFLWVQCANCHKIKDGRV